MVSFVLYPAGPLKVYPDDGLMSSQGFPPSGPRSKHDLVIIITLDIIVIPNIIVIIIWLYCTVCFQVSPQIACQGGCVIALVAFVWLLFAVSFHMCPQMAWLRGCIITLVTSTWLFSTVCFQVCPQITCPRGCKITLATFIWFFSTVCFRMFP